MANRMSSPPPRAPTCLIRRTVRPSAQRAGLGLLTVPDKSVPSALIVTVVGAGAAAPTAELPAARPADTASTAAGMAIVLMLMARPPERGGDGRLRCQRAYCSAGSASSVMRAPHARRYKGRTAAAALSPTR